MTLDQMSLAYDYLSKILLFCKKKMYIIFSKSSPQAFSPQLDRPAPPPLHFPSPWNDLLIHLLMQEKEI